MKRVISIVSWSSCLAGVIIMLALITGKAEASPAPSAIAGKTGLTITSTAIAGAHESKGKGPEACTYAWRPVSAPDQGSSTHFLLDMVALTGSDIWAVGYFYNGDRYSTLIERWNGTNWSVVPSPNFGTDDNELSAIAAVSDDDIWAVGHYQVTQTEMRSLILHWNGSVWSNVSIPEIGTFGDELLGVAAVSSNNVYAVGYKSVVNHIRRTLIMRWNGTTWSVVTSPNYGENYNTLYDIAVISSNDIWAVGRGSNKTLTMHWNGASWSIVSSPTTWTSGTLEGVAALSSNDVWAVGKVSDDNYNYRPTILHWNGATWVAVTVPDSGSDNSGLYDVSIWSANDVWAVGSVASEGPSLTLTEHWNGTSWSIVPSPNVGSDSNSFEAVAATSSGNIWAAGTYYAGNSSHPLFERYSLGCDTPSPTPSATATPTSTATPGACSVQFTDVPTNHTFYSYINCLACQGIIGGYADNTFRPGNDVTRGQIAKIVSNSAGFSESHSTQTFEDIPTNHTFYPFIERLASRGIIGGYACGGPGETCGAGSKPYFRSNSNATRGQLAKIVCKAFNCSGTPSGQTFEDVPTSHTFYTEISQLYALGAINGYQCGGPGEPCGAGNLPYFRPGANVSRGQTAKIVSSTFFPACQVP